MLVTSTSALAIRRCIDGLAVGVLQVQREAALVAVDRHELSAHAAVTELAGIAPGVAGQRLDLDDLGAPVAQHLRGVGTEQNAGEVEHLDAGERTGGLGSSEFPSGSFPSLRALVQQRLEIGARGLRFAFGGLGGFAEAEIAVNEPGAVMIFGGTPAAMSASA